MLDCLQAQRKDTNTTPTIGTAFHSRYRFLKAGACVHTTATPLLCHACVVVVEVVARTGDTAGTAEVVAAVKIADTDVPGSAHCVGLDTCVLFLSFVSICIQETQNASLYSDAFA